MTEQGPVALSFGTLEAEAELETLVIADPTLIGLDILVLGHQVLTAHGGYIDTLGLDSDGRVHVIELKRDRTPRDVVAQTLEYGSWATELTLEEATALFADHSEDGDLEAAFAERFSVPIPDVFNPDQQMTIVATELDPTSDRIVEYLAERFEVPINAVFFRYFQDGDSRYLTRTWLLPPEEVTTSGGRGGGHRRKGQLRPWNGRDFYVIQGTADGSRNDRWEIARQYGLLSAGGTPWYWKPLRNLTPGKRVFAYVGKIGYVGVGTVTGEMRPAKDVSVEVNGQIVSLLATPEVSEGFVSRASSGDPEVTEMVVPVEWDVSVPQEQAINETGLFASQVTVCKLRDQNTIETVEARFGLQDTDSQLIAATSTDA